jgi:hypothetical protein
VLEIGDIARKRDQFIPVRKSEIIASLMEEPAFRGHIDAVQRFCKLLGSIFHFENFEGLERLKDDYYYFNPELETRGEASLEFLLDKRRDLLSTLTDVFEKANYSEIPEKDIEDAHNQRHLLRVKVRAPLDNYHSIKFYERGRHTEKVKIREWLGLRSKQIHTTVFDNVVLVLVVKAIDEVSSKRQRKKLVGGDLKPGTILIKFFRNIAASDLIMILPKVRVAMSVKDQLTIGVPAIAGALPLLAHLLPALTVVGLVAGYYLGFAPALDNDTLVKSVGAVTGIAAVVGFVLTQRMKYQKRSLEYQKEISDHFYFRNVSNNSGIFDSLVGSAEEQEFKEAALAYLFLAAAERPLSERELDERIESWFQAKHSLDFDFEVDDAIRKLERLELLQRSDTGLTVLPLDHALIKLDTIWDNFFPYANEAVQVSQSA